jgi:hypothetical protein
VYDVDPDGSAYFSGSLRWSPDGTLWAMGENTEAGPGSPVALSLVSVDTGATLPLDLGLEQPIEVVGWLDRRTLLVFTSSYSAPPFEQRLLAVPIDAPRDYRTVPLPAEMTSAELGGFFMAPDLTQAAYTSLEGRLGIADLAGGAPIHPGLELGDGWMAWSPDGDRLVFWGRNEVELTNPRTWIVEADGTRVRPLTFGAVLVGSDPWRPAPE